MGTVYIFRRRPRATGIHKCILDGKWGQYTFSAAGHGGPGSINVYCPHFPCPQFFGREAGIGRHDGSGLRGVGAIATLVHNAGGTEKLFAFPPEPAAETRQGELMANRLYGIIDSRSPRTPYMCVWRDTDPTRYRAGADAGPPEEILLFCGFGTTDWTPPSNLIEHAEQAMRRDEAKVTIGWKRRDGDYAMTRLEVSVDNMAEGRNFRSVWFDDEVAGLAIISAFEFPGSPVDPIAFCVKASLPRRYNRGEPATKPIVTLAIDGRAPPIPDWVLY